MDDPGREHTAPHAGDLNALVNEGAQPAREDDRTVLVMPGRPRPWPKATPEDLRAFAEQQWERHQRGE